MSGQNFDDQFRPFKFTPVADPVTTSPVSNLDPMADKVPMDAALIHETAMGGTVAAVGPMSEMPVRVVPMGEAIPATSLVEGEIVHPLPLDPTMPYVVPAVESNTDFIVASKPGPYQPPKADMMNYEAPPVKAVTESAVTLLPVEEAERYRTHWNEIQGKFVDDPRTAVQQADALVSEVVDNITHMFVKEHSTLEGQWNQGSDVSTEDLRKALQHYRSFFNRLVL